ncbi:MAG: HAD-IC family P-type ATPase [Limibacillus sp.]
MTQGERKAAWQALSGEDALMLLESRREGLDSQEAAQRRKRFGLNILPRRQPPGWGAILLRQFTNPLVLLLIAAATISLIVGEGEDAAFIAVVLIFNAGVGAAQEKGAEQSAAALHRYMESHVRVLRPGGEERIVASLLVPGDIVALESGDSVPADLRLLESQRLSIDESLLSGESQAVAKDAKLLLPHEALLTDSCNLAFAGSSVNGGRALGLVVETGAKTQIGHISSALQSTSEQPPPLVLRITRFTRRLSIASVVIVAIIALADYMRGAELVEVFITAVALAVAAIPEGLPIAITVALSIASRRMAQHNVIVRALPAVEGLGACTLIASDKTGTLTENRLTILRAYTALDGHKTLNGRKSPSCESLHALLRAGLLCNDAQISGEETIGDAVDRAFLTAARDQGLMVTAERGKWPRLYGIPYEPERRYQATFHRQEGAQTSRLLACVKGAAEVVLPLCENVSEESHAVADALASEGLRVIAVASGELSEAEAHITEQPPRGLRFLGFVGLSDPLRKGAQQAVSDCARAGVRVCLVTGDHPRTALAIAQSLGLAQTEEEILTGSDLHSEDPMLEERICAARVFARVEPLQKLRIVESLMAAGHYVAVTGDGVNDAPALRSANIGVAMGRSGTDVARSAADLILTDDAFSSIVAGIEQGRIAYDNVRRVTLLLLATGFGEIVLFLLALIVGLPLPLFAVQLLWLNLVTNGIQDMALAFEKGEPDTLDRSPRPPSEPLFDRRMAEQVGLAGLYMGCSAFLVYGLSLHWGWGETQARSATLLMMVLFENVHALNCRSERRSILRLPLSGNPLLVLSIAGALGLHLASAWIPWLGDTLDIVPPTWEALALLIPLALGLVLLMESYKKYRGRKEP